VQPLKEGGTALRLGPQGQLRLCTVRRKASGGSFLSFCPEGSFHFFVPMTTVDDLLEMIVNVVRMGFDD
jgi:hypothetical protein